VRGCVGLPCCEADVPLAAAYLFLGQGRTGATRGTLTLSFMVVPLLLEEK